MNPYYLRGYEKTPLGLSVQLDKAGHRNNVTRSKPLERKDADVVFSDSQTKQVFGTDEISTPQSYRTGPYSSQAETMSVRPNTSHIPSGNSENTKQRETIGFGKQVS